MALPKNTCKECGWQCKSCEDQSGLHLHVEIENLKQRLLEREHHIVSMETNFLNEAEKFPNGEFSALTDELLTWQEKYSRLYESHKRVQKVNQSLEDKLLRLVDKSETEKNSLTRDLRSVSQRLMEARSKIKQLEDENERYRNDVNLAIQLLQCKPTNFVSQKIDSLSPELQRQVRTYVSSKRPDPTSSGTPKLEPKIIKVPIPTFPPTAMVYSLNKAGPGDKEENSGNYKQPVDIVSAAIMAKILEERARERSLTKHCQTCTCSSQIHRGTDCSTQTCSDQEDQNEYAHNLANTGNQGQMRILDVVASRNNNELLRNVKSSERNTEMPNNDIVESPKDSNLSSLRSKFVIAGPLLGSSGFTRNIESMKLNDTSLLIANENGNRQYENITRNGKCNSLLSESVPWNVNMNSTVLQGSGGGMKHAVKSFKKVGDMSCMPSFNEEVSLNMQDEALWSSLSSDSGSPVSNQVNIDMEVAASDLPFYMPTKSNRDVLYGKLDENKRLQSYLSKNETVRARNRESRTFLSDESNNTSKEGYKGLSPNKTSFTKPLDMTDINVGKTGLGMIPRKTRVSSETSGPRPCSLRMQAGTSNILLANATCYTPVLYTSRPDVLVHSPRSRSASASSTDTGTNSSPDT